MPRKNKGLPFEVHPGPQKNENNEPILYATTQSGYKRTLDDLDMWFGEKYGIRRGEMVRVFEAFMESAPKWMAEGFKIETPIGTFAAKIKLKQDFVNPDDITNNDADIDGIEFRIAKDFEKNMKYAVASDGFRYIRKAQSSLILNNIQHLETALQKSLKANNGYTTVASFAAFSGLTTHSARKQLNRWCHGDNPKLQRSRISHAHIYTEI